MVVLRSRTGTEGKSRKQGGHSVPEGKGSGHSAQAWRQPVKGNYKLLLMRQTGRREGESGLFSILACPNLPLLCPTGHSSRTILDETRERACQNQLSCDPEQSKGKEWFSVYSSRAARISLNKVKGHPSSCPSKGVRARNKHNRARHALQS